MLTQRRVHSSPTCEQLTYKPTRMAAAADADDDNKKERRPPSNKASIKETLSLLDPLALDLGYPTPAPVVIASCADSSSGGSSSRCFVRHQRRLSDSSSDSSEDGDGATLMRLLQYVIGFEVVPSAEEMKMMHRFGMKM